MKFSAPWALVGWVRSIVPETTSSDAAAVKVLSEAFTQDPQRMARFEREAKVSTGQKKGTVLKAGHYDRFAEGSGQGERESRSLLVAGRPHSVRDDNGGAGMNTVTSGAGHRGRRRVRGR
jgi:hypothetical protein